MIKSRAIVLHRYAYSDSSWIVKALTEECGIVSFIVKGGKRKESPFKGALDPLALSEVVFRQNPNTELQFVKEATLLDWHKDMRDDLLKTAKAQVMTEIVLRYAPAGVPLEGEFSLLEEALAALSLPANNAPDIKPPAGNAPESKPPANIPPSNVFAQWLLDICDLWGYTLDMHTCSRCGHQIEGAPADFHPETGAFVCKSCLGVESPRARKETRDGFYALRTGQGAIANPEFTENALLAYLRNHIGFLREINSLKFLNEARKLFPAT